MKLLRTLLQRGLELARSGEDVGERALGERVVQHANQSIGHRVQHAGLQLKIRVSVIIRYIGRSQLVENVIARNMA